MQSSQGTWTEFLRVPRSRCEDESVDTPLFGTLRKAIAMISNTEMRKRRVCADERMMQGEKSNAVEVNFIIYLHPLAHLYL